MLVTLEEAKAHCRVDPDYPDGQLAPYVAAAEDAVQAYLNRRVFADQSAMDAALSAIPGDLATAQADYAAAVEAANAETDASKRAAMLAVAEAKLKSAKRAATWVLEGVITNASIRAAALMMIGHLFAHREAVNIGNITTELPLGVTHLLRPYRRVMMP